MTWIDHSSILGHGHLLGTVKPIYDERFYLTAAEYQAKNGRSIDIQQEVEKPNLYFLASCPDTIEDKLMYAETRLDDLKICKQSKIELCSDHHISDNMRW